MPEPVCVVGAAPVEELSPPFKTPVTNGTCRTDGVGEMKFDHGIMRSLCAAARSPARVSHTESKGGGCVRWMEACVSPHATHPQ